MQRAIRILVVWLLLIFSGGTISGAELDPLASWNEGPSKKAIVELVERVTRDGGADYVKPEERIATFDHDGTLLGGAADVFPDHVRHGSGESDGTKSSGLEKQAAFQGGARP